LNYREDNKGLSQQLQQQQRQFHSFVSVILPFLPPDAQTTLQQQHQEQQHQPEQRQPQQDQEQS